MESAPVLDDKANVVYLRDDVQKEFDWPVEFALRHVELPIRLVSLGEGLVGQGYVSNAELVRRALGLIVPLGGPRTTNRHELQIASGSALPVLVLGIQQENRLQSLNPSLTTYVTLNRPDIFEDERDTVRVEKSIRQWVEDQYRLRFGDTFTVEEQRVIERFLAAFDQRLQDGTTGLTGISLVTASIQVQTINIQMRSPEPHRGIVKLALSAVGALLLGAGGNYLYDLLPHIK